MRVDCAPEHGADSCPDTQPVDSTKRLASFCPRPTTLLRLALLVIFGPIAGWGQDTDSTHHHRAGIYPDQILVDFKVEITAGNLRSAVILGDTAAVYRSRDSAIVQGLTVQLYDLLGRYSSTLLSDYGLVKQVKGEFVAHGHVQMETSDSITLTCDSLFWYGLSARDGKPGNAHPRAVTAPNRWMVAKHSVHLVTAEGNELSTDTLLWNDAERALATDADVTIVQPGKSTIRGRGLRSDQHLRRLVIESASGRSDDSSAQQ